MPPPTPNCNCSKLVVAPAGGCGAGKAMVSFKAGDRYDTSTPSVDVCVPTFGFDPVTKIYKVAFCWNTQCEALKALDGKAIRAYINNLDTTPGTGPDGLSGTNVVLTALSPACAKSTNIITLKDTGATYKFGTTELLVTIPAPIATLDVDVAIDNTATCNDQWVVTALVAVPQPLGTTPPIPPASCPCWQRTTNGTCPGIKVPILLETIDELGNNRGQSVMQCIDPANFDIYTGRMAYSYCWRYDCLPPVFATSRFKATCSQLERWNIAKMDGKFKLAMQRSEGLYMSVTGHPKNPALAPVVWTALNDQEWIELPPGGVSNMTFEYIIPPGQDDLSAAVVMDTSPRPPPPPVPPGPPGSSCACPLTPEQTVGGTAGVCNSTYATMTVRLESDPSVTFKQCVSWPNYDLIMQEMAWSHCWRYDPCLPKAFYGQAYRVSINEVSKHNIGLIPPAGYELLHFVAPFGMSIETTLKYASGDVAVYNSTQGSLVVAGRKNVISVPSQISNITIEFKIPAVWGIDGLAAAVVLRHIDGTDFPYPPSPPSPPPAPPSPPPLPAGAASVLITTDFLVLANVPLSALLKSSSCALSGYYVTIPFKFYDYLEMPDCSDSNRDAFKAKVAAAFNVSDPSTITVSCRFNVPVSNQPILRRMMRAVSRMVQTVATGTTPNDVAVETAVTLKLPVDFPAAVSNGCARAENMLASDVSCEAGSVTTKPSVTVTMSKSETVIAGGADPCSDAVSESANLLAALARDAGAAGVNSNTLRSTGCKSQRVAGTGAADPNAPGASPINGPGAAPTPGAGKDAPSSSHGLSSGAIAGIVIGAVAGAVLIGFVGVAVRNKVNQQSPVTMVGRDGTTRTTTPRGWGRGRWMTYSMQEKAEQARSGSAPVAGVSTY
ncbi:hypothetical protein HYH02_004959 [Chlamydomonas schloesseri]|uniref:Uncharacterized protein n=1 Tax=Chlamydomonas schloesseri TaxID=2026947 RepID=A0A836B822_9CHLO|nr:hypothetical protein HYH02_004959 [Chlamydomonas schloesseri]|eukprot:KAG2450457.1 hypothetical protein HYH02_004959 [Chlamydomonas schloesseri]